MSLGRASTMMAWCLAAMLAAGCAGTDSTAADGGAPPAEPGLFEPGESQSPRIVVRRGQYAAVLPDTFAASAPGLEILTWVTLDLGGRVAEVIDDLGRAPVARSEQLDRWSRSGVEVRLIELGELQDVLGQLPPMASLSRRAWGGIPDWQPVITARGTGDRLRIYDGVIDLDPGSTPRMLVRGWVEPAIGMGVNGLELSPRVRAELVPQWHAPIRRAFEARVSLNRAEQDGMVLEDLLLSMALEPGTALIVTSTTGEQGVGVTGVGPPVPAGASLGSVLFRLETKPEYRGAGAAGAASQIQPEQVTVLVLVPVVRTGAARVAGP